MRPFKICISIYIIILFIGLISPKSGQSNSIQYISYASQDLILHCDAFLKRFAGDPDSADIAEGEKLRSKSFGYITISSHPYLGLILGCGDEGEFILIDSLNPTLVKSRIQINIPGSMVVFDPREIRDINGDNVPELEICLSGSAHGYHSYFLSVYVDSLKFITDSQGNHDFFAATGSIRLIPTKNANIFDIEVDNVPEEGQIDNYTIYKWNGKNYEVRENTAKIDR